MTELPWSREAEIELVTAPYVDPAILDEVAEVVSPTDFYHEGHRTLHEAQLSVWRTRGALDQPLLVAELERRGIPGKRAADLLTLAGRGTTHNAGAYAELVRDRATLRRLIDAADDIARQARAIPEDVETYVCEAEARIRAVAETGARGRLETADAATEGMLDWLARARAGDADVLGLPTGFPRLDAETGGLVQGMTIVMGRPSNGKSAFALQVARRVAEQGHGVFIWSGEMASHVVMTRLTGCWARACIRDLLKGTDLEPDDWQRFQEAAHRLRDLPIMLDCQPGITAEQITVRAQRARRDLEARGAQLRLVVVDHFNLVNHAQRRQEKEGSAMGRTSNHFANWAKEACVSLVNVCQLNRKLEGRDDKRPRMSDIRECGKIEEDAETMLGMYITAKNEAHALPGAAEVIIAKCRIGKTQPLPYHYDGPSNRFLEQGA